MDDLLVGIIVLIGMVGGYWVGFGDGREAGRKRSLLRLDDYCATYHRHPSGRCLNCHALAEALNRKEPRNG